VRRETLEKRHGDPKPETEGVFGGFGGPKGYMAYIEV